jgi:hypothetical protein
MAASVGFSLLLYESGASVWRQGRDAEGSIDVAVLEIDRAALPRNASYRAFTCEHLHRPSDQIEVGAALLIVGFPLGFHDTFHHMPVVRHAVIASSFDLRFQGKGYFLTDARTHRGTSGAAVVRRDPAPDASRRDLPWVLLGVHSSRLDVGSRDFETDEALGLNCSWFADILRTLTDSSMQVPHGLETPHQ